MFAICLVLHCTMAPVFAQEQSGSETSEQSMVTKLKLLLRGLAIGNDARILPYASLEDWFDPYGGLKLGHDSIFNSEDKMLHHFKFETVRDFSWKYRYLANSISSPGTKFSFLFKLKFDRDAFFYGIGNNSVKKDREPATYSSVFLGVEMQELFDKFVYRWSPGVWQFNSGLAAGGEFEQASSVRYLSSRFTLASRNAMDYWNASWDNFWTTYVEFGLPTRTSTAIYARLNFQTVTRFPVFQRTKLGVGTRLEFLLSPNKDNVPYFAMPEVGSRSGLRGFSKERFRDYAVFALNLEYSYILSRDVESFLLLDMAKTSSNLNFLPLKNIHANFGVGLRYKNDNKPISVGVTQGNEGWKLFSTIATGLPW